LLSIKQKWSYFILKAFILCKIIDPVIKPQKIGFDENDFERIRFPDYSPNLNPIENLSALKQAVNNDAPRSEKGLIKSL